MDMPEAVSILDKTCTCYNNPFFCLFVCFGVLQLTKPGFIKAETKSLSYYYNNENSEYYIRIDACGLPYTMNSYLQHHTI